MARPIFRRALVPVAALFLICTLLRNSTHHSPTNYPSSVSFPEAAPIRVTNPFINSTRYAPIDAPVLEEEKTKFDDDAVNEVDAQGVSFRTKIPPALLQLTRCPPTPNRFTNHIRLSNLLHNISMSPMMATVEEKRDFWNPTIIALPRWSRNQ
jgi:hypothetical protein